MSNCFFFFLLRIQLSSAIDTGLKMKELGGLYISFDGSNKQKSLSNSSKSQKDLNNQDELLKKSVIVPDFEKKDAVPPYSESKHAAKLKRKAEREKTTGDGWFNMRAPELTEELKNDLKALKMRSAMDPKRFYKKNDREGFPKYFQVGWGRTGQYGQKKKNSISKFNSLTKNESK
uniref:Fcf2 pre-rRNA processing C-terminal domain-containing protein n=1 Tax=Cyprinus carpio TaxID=7962 RepID=A0A8C2AYY2_CYPCA